MNYSIHLGIPEMLNLWTKLKQANSDGSISSIEAKLYKKWVESYEVTFKRPILSQFKDS